MKKTRRTRNKTHQKNTNKKKAYAKKRENRLTRHQHTMRERIPIMKQYSLEDIPKELEKKEMGNDN